MHEDHTNLPRDDDWRALLDRLVDGELGADQRREVLRSLDQTPGAWRDCALAFLEAQAMREGLGALVEESIRPEAAVSGPPHATDQASKSSAPVWWAVAASALIAFGVGSAATRWTNSPVAAPGPTELAGDPPITIEAPEVEQGPAIEAPPMEGGEINDDESLTLWVSDDRGRRQSFRAPLVDAATLDDRFGLTFPSAVSPEVRQRLEGDGFRLSTRRRYAPLFLDNGQPVVVPVEDVQIGPVKGTAR
ncbi:MAG: hypothetical protein AAF589_05845 [Planctomycetota bacterium]